MMSVVSPRMSIGIFLGLLYVVLLSVCSGQQDGKSKIPNLDRIRSADVIMHIGPPKTATDHLQYTTLRLNFDLDKAGWCYPVKSQDEYHNLVIDLREGRDPQDKELVKRIFACLKGGKKLFISSEKFFRVESDEGFRKIKDFFKDYKVHVVASFRDPLTLAYSWYHELSKSKPQTPSFPQHMVIRNFDSYDTMIFGTMLFDYEKRYTLQNMTILDFHGMIAAKKDPAYVMLCEVMGTMCDAHYYPEEGSNPSRDLRPAYLFAFVRNFVFSLGCTGRNESALFSILEPRYKELNMTTLPMMETHMDLVAHLARSIEKRIRGKFTPVMAYSNPAAAEETRSKFLAKEIDEAAFFQNPEWTAWLWAEVKRLQDGGVIVADKCKVRLNLGALAASTS